MADSNGISGKRKQQAAANNQWSRKRAKLAHKTKGPGHKTKKGSAPKSGRVVHVDALAWKTVEVPEMHDDAEGFFGLEEVEGVDIVRNGDKVHFVSSLMLEVEAPLACRLTLS